MHACTPIKVFKSDDALVKLGKVRSIRKEARFQVSSNRTGNLPFVSIVIPTVNRKNKLKKCLESLKKLDYPKSLLEIIVVDNGSVDGTSNMVSSEFEDAKLVVEPRRGVSSARNTGALHSRGEIISFLDDDCQVEKSWLRKIVRNFSGKGVIGVGGPVILKINLMQVGQKLLDISMGFSNFDLGSVRRNIVGPPYLSGANMSFQRKAFECASFDPRLGPPMAYLEDFDFCDNLLRLGFELLYDPEPIVYHIPVISKFSLSYILFNRGPKEGFSIYYFNRKRMPWFKVLRRSVYSCLIFIYLTFKFLMQRNGTRARINLIWLAWHFYAVWACLRMLNLLNNTVIGNLARHKKIEPA